MPQDESKSHRGKSKLGGGTSQPPHQNPQTQSITPKDDFEQNHELGSPFSTQLHPTLISFGTAKMENLPLSSHENERWRLWAGQGWEKDLAGKWPLAGWLAGVPFGLGGWRLVSNEFSGSPERHWTWANLSQRGKMTLQMLMRYAWCCRVCAHKKDRIHRTTSVPSELPGWAADGSSAATRGRHHAPQHRQGNGKRGIECAGGWGPRPQCGLGAFLMAPTGAPPGSAW